eukprot:COSAG02_NODE_62838_length_264_cov_6.618182_1_plen_53_part_01
MSRSVRCAVNIARTTLLKPYVAAPACMHSLARNARVRTEISLVEIHTSLPYYN